MKSTSSKVAISALVLSSLSAVSLAAQANPFAAEQLQAGYQLASAEASCGADKSKEAKCGEDKAKKEKEGKCGEGKCGEDKKDAKDKAKKDKEGKCGEGKCGGAA
ncbi:hypothetical protein [Rheinheimera sp.]|uniref:HvfA family oxazolone/thioamide-modified RiPP metallophore n=1 Tax=Rheinheimera sp. TaxID=1869214 RepID=UPI003AF8461C